MPGLHRLPLALLALWLCACASSSSQLQESAPPPEGAKQERRAEAPSSGSPPAPSAPKAALEAQVQQGQAHLQADRPEEALEAFEAVLKQDNGNARARQGAKDARLKLGPRVFAQAEADLRDGRLGAALLGFVRAELLEPGAARGARAQAETVRGRLLEELTFLVETPEVVDKAKAPEVTERLTPGRLGAALPRGVPVRLVPQAPPEARGVRAQVTVERVDTLYERKQQSRSAKVQVGHRAVENPDWRKLEDKLQTAERALGDSEREVWVRIEQLHEHERKLDDTRRLFERCQVASVASCAEALRICRNAVGTSSCDVPTTCDADACRLFAENGSNAEVAYNQARVRLREGTEQLGRRREEVLRARELRLRTPALTEAPTYGEFPYEVEAHTATLRAAVTFQLDPLDPHLPRATPQTKDFVARAEDQTHRSYELYGIRGDPLELESEKELKRKAGESALEALALAVRAELDRSRAPLRDEARRALQKQGMTPEVVELAVRASLVYPDERPQDLLEALSKAYRVGQPQALYAR